MIARWVWMVAIGGLLVGCQEQRVPVTRPPSADQDLTIPDDSTPQAVGISRFVAVPVARVDTVVKVDTVRKTGVDTTPTGPLLWVSDSITNRRIITTVKVKTSQPEVITRPFPFGVFNLPPDSLCSTVLPFNLTVFPIIPASIMGDLARVKQCRKQAIIQYPRRIMQRGINKDVRLVRAWLQDSVPDLCPYVADSTILGFWTGDDVTKTTEWVRGTYQEQMARWDTLGMIAKEKCAGFLTILRARPTQMLPRPAEGKPDSLKWRWTDASWSQYAGWKQAGDVRIVVPREDSIAKRLGLGNLHGLNILSGGCGPDPAKCPVMDGVRLKGTSYSHLTNGTIKYEMGADELYRFGKVEIQAAYGCGFTMWAWGPKWDSNFQQRPDNIKATDSLAILARQKTPKTCKGR